MLEVVFGERFTKGARVSDVVEELSAWDQLLDYVGDPLLIAVLFVYDGILFEIEVLYDIWVIKLVSCFNFFLKKAEGPLVEVRVFKVENLEGIFLIVLVACKLDLGAEAAAKSLLKCERVQSVSHFTIVSSRFFYFSK